MLTGCPVAISALTVVGISVSALLIVVSGSLGLVALERGVKAVLKDGVRLDFYYSHC